jgi:acylphosphatase
MSEAPHQDDTHSGGTEAGGTGNEPDAVRLTAWVRGRVQGVGFRWWVRSKALELGLVGSAANLDDGRVEVIAEGSKADCERLLGVLRGPDAPGSVSGVTDRWSEACGDLSGFQER